MPEIMVVLGMEILYEVNHIHYPTQPFNRIVKQKSGIIQLQCWQPKSKFKARTIMVARSLIDEQDIELISRYTWSFTGKYIITSKKPTVALHRLIAFRGKLAFAECYQHLDVHHKNGNPLNNRRKNLEILQKTEHKLAHQS